MVRRGSVCTRDPGCDAWVTTDLLMRLSSQPSVHERFRGSSYKLRALLRLSQRKLLCKLCASTGPSERSSWVLDPLHPEPRPQLSPTVTKRVHQGERVLTFSTSARARQSLDAQTGSAFGNGHRDTRAAAARLRSNTRLGARYSLLPSFPATRNGPEQRKHLQPPLRIGYASPSPRQPPPPLSMRME